MFDGMATTWRLNLGAIVTHVREGTLISCCSNRSTASLLSLRTLSPAGLPVFAWGLGFWLSHQADVVFSLSLSSPW